MTRYDGTTAAAVRRQAWSIVDLRAQLAESERRRAVAQGKVDAVEVLVRRARLVSSGPRAVVYVADLEVALGLASELAPSKLGQNGDGS